MRDIRPRWEFFVHACKQLRWHPTTVAVWFGYSRSAGSKWAKGEYAVPDDVIEWLEDRMDGILYPPIPQKKRTPGRPSKTEVLPVLVQ